MEDRYTRPERATEREHCTTIRARVVRDGGCRYCTRRAHIFETVGRLAACGLNPPRAFPACVEQPGGFEFDEAAYTGRAKGDEGC